jgi:hypothetical protein
MGPEPHDECPLPRLLRFIEVGMRVRGGCLAPPPVRAQSRQLSPHSRFIEANVTLLRSRRIHEAFG